MNPENPKPVFHSREQNENTRLQEDLRQHQAELEMQNEELRKSQENIEKVQQAYRDLYENAPVGYITLDQKGAIVRANLTFYRIICTPGSNCRTATLHYSCQNHLCHSISISCIN